MAMSERQASDTRPRFVVLGASNIARNLTTILAAGRAIATPMEILVAHGHGRSYGGTSRVLLRQLPGIVHCGLWSHLAERRDTPTWALVTDIGNDILYGFAPALIADWVARCVDRLQAAGARVAITHLPLANLARLGPRKFALMRTMLFPGSPLTLADAQRHAEDLNDRVERIATQTGSAFVSQNPAWYGFDPIHILASHAWPAYRAFLGTAFDIELPIKRPRVPLGSWAYYQTCRPQQVWYAGLDIGRRQPVARWSDGTTLGLW